MSGTSIIGIYAVLLLLLSGCLNHSKFSALEPISRPIGQKKQPAEAASPSYVREGKTPTHYLVKPGDTLYSIAFRYGLDYKKLAYANNIDSQYRIYEGHTLLLKEAQPPKTTVSSPHSNSAKKTSNATHSRRKTENQNTTSQNVDKPKVASESTVTAKNTWKWPHYGKIVRTFSSSTSGNRGIDMQGRIGDAVSAATNGVVVYAGNGLPGYGNLVILEHSNGLLSAYAFNEKILVKEDEKVSTGQKIATMGKLGDQPGLHFEIRQNGKPINPLNFLPKR